MNIPGFIEEKVLGKGSYGTVYKAKRVSDNISYAVKVVDTTGMDHRELQDAVNEIRLMASFQSPFIVSFCEAFPRDRKLCVVTEYARLGDLSKLIDRRKRQCRPLLEDDIWRFLIQITEGLSVLHECGVVHRDIKSANLLLCAPDLVKIGDLGISTVLRNHQLAKTQIGTPLYLAPEIWKRRPYDAKCDMWSLGVVLYEMLNFSFPFVGRSTEDLGRRILAGRIGPIRGGYSAEIQAVLRSLLQVNPDLRPSSHDLLEMQSIKKRMYLIHPVIVEEKEEHPQLLQTIQVPYNIRQVSFPKPKYNDSNELVKPIGERIHVKGGKLKAEIDQISTRELMMVADHDWWSPNKLAIKENDEEFPRPPLSERSPYVPPVIPTQAPANVVKPIPQIGPNPRPLPRPNDENANPNMVAQIKPKVPTGPKNPPPRPSAWPPANYYYQRRPYKPVQPPRPTGNAAPRRQQGGLVPPWGYNPVQKPCYYRY